MKGTVKIRKLYQDGTEELVCEDNNVLTDGLGLGIINIFTDTGSRNIEDHLVGYFQAGIGRLNPTFQPLDKRKYISNLKTPLSEANYGKNTELEVNKHKLYKLHKGAFNPSLSPEVENSDFVVLSDDFSTKLLDGVVHYRLTLGETDANGLSISEFGLFARNPEGDIGNDKSVLLAYKNFPVDEALVKNKEFALVVDWQIKFIDEVNSEIAPPVSDPLNVVFIMIDDVGLNYLGMYDELNPYDLSSTGQFTSDGLVNPNCNPYSQIDDPVNGSGIYPHTPCLSSLVTSGVLFKNVRSMPTCSPTRSSVITGKYNFSCKNWNQTNPQTGGIWGPGMGTVMTPTARRARGGLKGLNSSYSLLPDFAGGEGDGQDVQPFEDLARGGENDRNEIAGQKVFAEYMRDNKYNSSFFGKWHLSKWEEEIVYCEGVGDLATPTVYGNGWGHISEVGKWDHYFATWANLRGDAPIPGKKFDGAWQAGDGGPVDSEGNIILGQCWPNFGIEAADCYYLKGDEMGFVNFFALSGTLNVNQVVTVSDTGYVPPALSASTTGDGPVTYAQGAQESFATNRIFSEAAEYFNTSAINPEPFFMYITPNAPHDPWTYPHYDGVFNPYYKANHPQILLQDGNPACVGGGGVTTEYATSASWITVNSQLENFDYALSGFLDSLDPDIKNRTIFIVTSDNGSVYNDMAKRGKFCVSSVGSNYLGVTFSSMLNLEDLCQSQFDNHQHAAGSVLQVRRGGDNDSANGFKASMYQTGVGVPMIAYGPSAGVLQGSSTDAFVDLVDVLATVVDAGGGEGLENVPSDSISFFDVMTGATDASSHPRQYGFSEAFFPAGNSFGDRQEAGSNTGWALNCTIDRKNVGQGNPTIPAKARRCLAVRHLPEEYEIRPYPSITPQVIANSGLTIKYAGDGVIPAEGIADASGGTWKIVRPSGGDEDLIGRGSKFDEIYHLQKADFTDVDPYEQVDYIPEEWKGILNAPGEPGPLILSGLIASAINVVGDGGTLDNTVHEWNLARIYDVLRTELSYFVQFRRDPSTSVLSISNTSDEHLDLDT